jgi:hypothetical protein
LAHTRPTISAPSSRGKRAFVHSSVNRYDPLYPRGRRVGCATHFARDLEENSEFRVSVRANSILERA